MSEKFCIHCKETLPVSLFSRDKRRLDGYSPYCRECRSELRKNENRNPELARQARLKHYTANRERYRAEYKQPEQLVIRRNNHRKKQATDPDYRERARERARKAYKANPERHSRNSKEWRERNAEKLQRARFSLHLRKTYGITVEDYYAMVDSQNGLCAICGQPPRGLHKRLAVDHCHTTGKVRKLLCSPCNTALGSMRDSIDLLAKAIDYLKSHSI